MCGAVHCSDISILGVHRKPPVIEHTHLDKMCEIPTTIAACPTAAIKPAKVDGYKSVQVNVDRCMFCGNCYTMCPAMPLADAEGDGIALWVGGKVSNARTAPMFSKLAVPYIPNEPPRWPSTVKAIKQILETYAADANKYERIGEWINRIGWERFFEKTGLEFSHHHIDDYRLAMTTWRTTTQFKF
jgi:sulfite reductase beta subunit